LNRVAAVELGLSDEVSLAEIHGLVRAVRSTGEWPLLVRLPLARAVELAEATALAGADVLTIGAPPRGIVPQPAGHLAGRLYGPGILPLALRAVVQVRAMVSLPIIGAGGIHQLEDVQAFLRSGAQAVQLDSVVWWQPQRVNQIAAAFQKKV
jgi:dihydroorotate dehydrogenase (NAD+) catalytic subunit